MAKSNVNISVVIPSYNSEKTISSCLQSILDQKTNLKYEVILVDSSSDSTPRLVKENFPEVILVHFNKRTPRGKALNVGIKRAKGDVVVCIDSDCIVANRDWINNTFKAHKKYDIVGARIGNGNPKSIFGWGIFLLEFCEWIGNRDKEMKMLLGFDIAYKKKIFEKYGLFSDDSSLNEDLIFHSRIKEPLFFSSNIFVKHINRTNFFKIINYCFKLGRGGGLARKQFPDMLGSFFVRRPIFIPLLPFARLAHSGLRSLQAGYFLIFLLTSPLIFINSVSYSLGFLTSVLTNQS